MTDENDPNQNAFRANAHLLKLLGDELIGDDRLAVFELVKNSYDADADSVDVTLNLGDPNPNLVVWDHNADGMSLDTVKNKWLEIGTPSKRAENRVRTVKGRMPLGEKGVGRLAVHKLGNRLKVNTKNIDSKEVRITIYWPSLISGASYIQDTFVDIVEMEEGEFFFGAESGTRIEISDLNNTDWQRKDIRKLKRLITSLKSPFNYKTNFDINFKVPGRESDLKDILDSEDVLSRATWVFSFEIDESAKLSYSYEFAPPQLLKLENKSFSKKDTLLELIPLTKEEKKRRKEEKANTKVGEKNEIKYFLTSDDLKDIGPISGKFYIFTRNKVVMNADGSYQSIKEYLDEQCGIRVFRDGIRVFNYGESNDDWLGLNNLRVNNPGKKVSNNNIIGAIDLDLEKSLALKEKTNREGFDENLAFHQFKSIALSVIECFHGIHVEDRAALEKKTNLKEVSFGRSSFEENIKDIKVAIEENNLGRELTGKVSQIESDFRSMRDVTVNSGMAGMNLAVIFHEVERGIDQLSADIERSADYESLKEQAEHLSKILEGFTPLLRRNEHKLFSVKDLVSQVFVSTKYRFKHHKIISSSPLLTGESPDFKVKAPFGLIRGTLNNIIDNAIHWTSRERELKGEDSFTPAIRVITLLDWFPEGPALVVLDNGPGFSLPADIAVQPFKFTRTNGMGLGLYYADQVMSSINGKLIITTAEELELIDKYSGAAVALIFKMEQ